MSDVTSRQELEYVAHLAQEASKPPKGGSEADEDEDEFGVRASWEVLQALDTSGDEMVDWAEFQEAQRVSGTPEPTLEGPFW